MGFRVEIASHFLVAMAGAAGISAAAFFGNDIGVKAISLFTDGEIGGSPNWQVVLLGYDDSTPPKVVRFSETAELKQLGFRITGTFKSEHKEWTAEGYYNRPYISLAYVNIARGAIGTGTYALREVPEGAFAFIGFWTGVECKAKKQILLKTPVLFVRENHLDLISRYDDFLSADRAEELEPEPTNCPAKAQESATKVSRMVVGKSMVVAFGQ
jgi:hypothetical protein